MSGLDFASYFEAVHGVRPFPWQERLLAKLIDTGEWPSLIDLPTASGKTACMDVALFYLAWCIERGEPWRASRRIVFVVDRRIVVDAAAARAQRIHKAISEPGVTALSALRDALCMAGGDEPLMCQTLRGGMPRERDLTFNPAQPMLITSTVDQVGSRLLFRGYGLSRYSWPIHAGLLGFDTLILLDEAHLSAPFVDTVEAVRREQARAEQPVTPVRPVRVVPLSATARSVSEPFRLGPADLAHPTIAARLNAPKDARLIEVSKPAEKVKALLRETMRIYAELADLCVPAVAVIVNRVRLARELFDALQDETEKQDFQLELMIGRSRPLDRDRVAARVIARAEAGRAPHVCDRGLIVVATQTIEVGADLDFHGIVTEGASLDALRQRFGRLDRLGTFRQARAVVVGGSDADDDPVYGAALNRTWRELASKAKQENGCLTFDFSIEGMHSFLKGVDATAFNTEPRLAPQLTPLHLELLVQTEPEPMYQPDVAALLHGFETEAADVQIVWRENLPIVRASDGQLVLDRRETVSARALLALNPPSSLEAAALPVAAVRSWLGRTADKPSVSDVEGAGEEDDLDVKTAASLPVLIRRADDWEFVYPRYIRPGDTVVSPSEYGGCDEYGFAPNDEEPVRDLSSEARAKLQRSSLLVLTSKTLASQETSERPRAAWRDLADVEAGAIEEQQVERLLISLDDSLRSANPWLGGDTVFEAVPNHDGFVYAIVIEEAATRAGDLSDENDISSSRTRPVALRAHNLGVGKRARELGASIQLPHNIVETLGTAGDTHDWGKADPRFQQLLRAGNDRVLPGELLAKGARTSKQVTVRLGERHETYSVALIKRYPQLLSPAADPELALYLVGTHHGRGRPLMPERTDEGTRFQIHHNDEQYVFEGAPELGVLGSGWSSTFWTLNRRYGPWGLAYLESVLRLADWLRSVDELKSGERP